MKEKAMPTGKSNQIPQEKVKRRLPRPVYYYSNERSPDFNPPTEKQYPSPACSGPPYYQAMARLRVKALEEA